MDFRIGRFWEFDKPPRPFRACLHLTVPVCALRHSAGRLFLKLLPLPSRLVILPMDHMRIDFLGRAYRPMPRRADTAGRGTPPASKCEQCECLSECKLAPFGSLSRRNNSDTAQGADSPVWALPLRGLGHYCCTVVNLE